jgi:hypothetical protein
MKEHGLRHLPVMTDGKLVGIVSDRDLAEAQALRGRDGLVEEAMSAKPLRGSRWAARRTGGLARLQHGGTFHRRIGESRISNDLVTDAESRATPNGAGVGTAEEKPFSVAAVCLRGRGVGLRIRFRCWPGWSVRRVVPEHALRGASLHDGTASTVHCQGDWTERHVVTSR